MDLRPTLDFSTYMIEHTRDFVGREWVFRSIEDWLARTPGPRTLLLTGEPGCGKTAIAAALCLASTMEHGSEKGHGSLSGSMLSAFHFCSARDRYWTDPFTFAGSVATQLANRYSAVLEKLTERREELPIRVDVKQDVGMMAGGQVTGVIINVGGPSAEDAFMRAVREPLEALFNDSFDGQVVILVDAIDEALQYSGGVGIVPLLAQAEHLPSGVRFILTSRPDDRVDNQFPDAETISLSGPQYDSENRGDIAAYVRTRLAQSPHLRALIAELPLDRLDGWTNEVIRRSDSNFQYVAFLLRSIEEGRRTMDDLERLPEGLDGLYYDSVTRVLKLGGKDWLSDYAPLLGLLSVAEEGLTVRQLRAFSGQHESLVWNSMRDIAQFIEEGPVAEGELSYRLFHQSFVDFLGHRSLVLKGKTLHNGFYLPSDEWHERIVRHYLAEKTDLADMDWRGIDDYGLRHLVSHLYALRSLESYRTTVYGVINSRFRSAKNRRFSSDEGFILDVERAIEVAQEEALAGAARVLALSAGQATLRQESVSVPLPVLLLLFRIGRRDEALARLQNLTGGAGVNQGIEASEREGANGGGQRAPDEVRGLAEMAAICQTEGDAEQARILLERALNSSVQVFDQDLRWLAIKAAVQGCIIQMDQPWIERALNPMVEIIRRFTSEWYQTQGLLVCARQFHRVGLRERARELAEEATEIVHRMAAIGDGSLAIDLARIWNELEEPVPARQVVMEALGRAGVEAETQPQVLFPMLIAVGRLGDASILARDLEEPFRLLFSDQYLDSRDSVEQAWTIVDGMTDVRLKVQIKIALARRMSEIGLSEEALGRLRELEKGLPEPSRSLADRITVRLAAAEQSRAAWPDQARALLMETLHLYQAWSQQALAKEELAWSSEFAEDALLRLVSDVAAIRDRAWSEAVLEEILAALIRQRPVTVLTSMTADMWQARAKAAVAAAMAEIGAIERASVLIAEALDDAARMRSSTSRRETLAAIAESVASAGEPHWVKQTAQKVLAFPIVKPGFSDFEAWTALARQEIGLSHAGSMVQEVVDRLLVVLRELTPIWDIPAYRLDPSLREELTNEAAVVINRLMDLLPEVSDQDRESIISETWRLALQVEDTETRRGLVEELVSASAELDLDLLETRIGQLDRPWDRSVARAALASFHSGRAETDKAGRAIERALDEAEGLSWTDGVSAALAAVISAIPYESELAGGWLVNVLLHARNQDSRVWLIDRLLTSASEELRSGSQPEAGGLVDFAMERAEGIRDPATGTRVWALLAVCLSQLSRQRAAKDAYARALSHAGKLTAAADRIAFFGIGINNLADVETIEWMRSLIDAPEYALIRNQVLAVLAARLAVLEDADHAHQLLRTLPPSTRRGAMVQVAIDLAKAGELEQAWVTVERLQAIEDRQEATARIAITLASSNRLEDAFGAADRLTETSSWTDLLAQVTASAAGTLDSSGDAELMVKVKDHLEIRLVGTEFAVALARIAGRLVRPNAARTIDRVGSGGLVPLALRFLEAALSIILQMSDEQANDASVRALVAMAPAGTIEEPDPALHHLLEWVEQTRHQAAVMADVAESALNSEHFECAEDAGRWLLAHEAWLWCAWWLVSMAGLSEWIADLDEEDVFATSLALGRIIPKLVDKQERAAAESWASGLRMDLGRAYVLATLADALRTQGDMAGADRVLSDALQTAMDARPMVWADASIQLAQTLTAAGRVDDAYGLAEAVQDSVLHNDVIDAIAGTLADLGNLEGALATLKRLGEVNDPLAAYRANLRFHTAAGAVAEALAEQGEFRRSAAIIQELRDPWAAPSRQAARDTLGEQLAKQGADEGELVAELMFDALKSARYSDRDEVLYCISSFAPVLRSIRVEMPMEVWNSLREVEEWSSTS